MAIINNTILTKTATTSEPTVTPITEEVKDSREKYNLSKFDYDLYKEEDDIALPIIRIKHISLPNKGERWKVFSDSKVILIVEGTKLTNKEKDFLHTVDGANFLIGQVKAGIKSFNALKTSIKNKLK